MKVALQDNSHYILRFDTGEQLFDELVKFLSAQGITASQITAIGTCTQVELGYYNIVSKKYERHNLMEELEVLTLAGNTAMLEGKPVVHLHGSFGRQDLSVIGGHVFSMTIAATTELNLVKLSGQIQRGRNEEFGLNLLV